MRPEVRIEEPVVAEGATGRGATLAMLGVGFQDVFVVGCVCVRVLSSEIVELNTCCIGRCASNKKYGHLDFTDNAARQGP